jgi:hypothetical protein
VTLNFQIAISTSLAQHDWHNSGWGRGIPRRAAGLFAETGFHRDPLAPLGATAGNNFLAALGLHAHAKSVCLRSLAPVGLECTLGQSSSLLIPSTVLGQTVSINHPPHYLQTRNPSRKELMSIHVRACVVTHLRRGRWSQPHSGERKSTTNSVRGSTDLSNLCAQPLIRARSRCTFSAAVTIALLDSAMQSVLNSHSRENSWPNFSTQQKNLCYYAALILLPEFFLLLAAAPCNSGAFRSKLNVSSYFVKRQF